jgi:hypothetical protein
MVEEVLVRNFNSPFIWSLGIAENVAKYKAFKRCTETAKS